MCTRNRLLWLSNEIWRGRSATVSFSFNESTQQEKIKFVLTDAYVSRSTYRPVLLAAIYSIESALESSIVTDKGHKSRSKDCSILEFWVKQPAQNNNDVDAPLGNTITSSKASGQSFDGGSNVDASLCEEVNSSGCKPLPDSCNVPDQALSQSVTDQGLHGTAASGDLAISPCMDSHVDLSTNEEFIRRVIPEIDSGIRRWVGSYRALFPNVLEAQGLHFSRPDMRQTLHAGGAELLDSFRKLCHENVGQILTSLPPEVLANRHVQRRIDSVLDETAADTLNYWRSLSGGDLAEQASSSGEKAGADFASPSRLDEQHPDKKLSTDPGFGKGPSRTQKKQRR